MRQLATSNEAMQCLAYSKFAISEALSVNCKKLPTIFENNEREMQLDPFCTFVLQGRSCTGGAR